jgi:hypothetical protein
MSGKGSGMPSSAHASATGYRPVGPGHQAVSAFLQTLIEPFTLVWIMPPFQLDAPPNFGKHNHACPDLVGRGPSDPTGNVWIGSVAFADFGNDVCIEQELHKSTLRQSRWRG